MGACGTPVVASWRLSACTLLAVCLGALPRGHSEGVDTERRLTMTHTVAQTYKLFVHDSGNVDVSMLIDFQLQPGAVLGGSYKSILSDSNIQSIDGGRVTATDGAGRGLPLKITDNNGWVRADFTFAEPLDGTLTPSAAVNLTYTVVGGICLRSAKFQRFSLPWAHRWAVTVTESKYEIEFADPRLESVMDSICFGATGFTCGHDRLTINGKRASYQVSGRPHGAFFEWTGIGAYPDRRPCTGISNFVVRAKASGSTDSGRIGGEADDKNVAFTAGLVAISSSFLLAGFICFCALKMPTRLKAVEAVARKMVEGKRKIVERASSSPDKMDADVEAMAAGSKVNRRPAPLNMNLIPGGPSSGTPNSAAPKNGTPDQASNPDMEAPVDLHPAGSVELTKDSGAGVWSLETPASSTHVVSWAKDEASSPDKTGSPMVANPSSPTRKLEFSEEKERGRISSDLSSYPVIGEEVALPVTSDEWQVMDEFGADDEIYDRTPISPKRGPGMATTGEVSADKSDRLSDTCPEIWEPMEEYSPNSRHQRLGSTVTPVDEDSGIPANEDSGGWEVPPEFTDAELPPSANCQTSVNYSSRSDDLFNAS